MFLFSFLTFLFSQQAEITNIQASQRTDGSQIVDITYDLLPDPVFEFFEISVLVSLDGGNNYTVMWSLEGDFGDIIEPGNGKTLTWDFGQQFGGTYSDQIKIKIEGSSYALVNNNNNQELPFEIVSVPAGVYTFGENNETRTIDYDYEIMKYEVTDQDYVLYMIDAMSNSSGCTDLPFDNQFGDTCELLEDFEAFCFNSNYYGGNGWDACCTCGGGTISYGVIISSDNLTGYYPGDANYPAGEYTFINFGNSKISWNGEIFEVEEGNVNHPVTGVTWFGAWAFATHYGMEIPDQYEWEKAARGNTGYDYPFGDQINPESANYNDTYVGLYGIGANTSQIGAFNGTSYECLYLGAESLMITEIADPQNSSESGRFVEIYNGYDNPIDLSAYQIQRWTNDLMEPQEPINLSGIIGPKDFYIICNDSQKFNNTYVNMSCDLSIGSGGPADSNGDDTIALLYAGVIMDIFGIPGQDGTGTAAEFEDGRAERAPWTTGSSNTWIESDWIVDNDSGGGDGNQYAPEGYDPGFWIGDDQNLSFDENDNFCDYFVTVDAYSAYDAYDMAGNVWEIVKNGDDSYFIRGGAYNSQPNQLQSWYQESYNGSSSAGNIGFRCMRIINQSQSRTVPKEKLKEYYLNKKNNTQKSNLKK